MEIEEFKVIIRGSLDGSIKRFRDEKQLVEKEEIKIRTLKIKNIIKVIFNKSKN